MNHSMLNIFDLSCKNAQRPAELDQFLNLINEDILIKQRKIFRDRNFEKINKWYKAIKYLKNCDPHKSKPTQGLIRLHANDY